MENLKTWTSAEALYENVKIGMNAFHKKISGTLIT